MERHLLSESNIAYKKFIIGTKVSNFCVEIAEYKQDSPKGCRITPVDEAQNPFFSYTEISYFWPSRPTTKGLSAGIYWAG